MRGPTCLRTIRLARSSYRRLISQLKLDKVTVSPGTEFEIDKIERTRNKSGIKQHLVSGEDTTRHSTNA